jgi:hypothetical protein
VSSFFANRFVSLFQRPKRPKFVTTQTHHVSVPSMLLQIGGVCLVLSYGVWGSSCCTERLAANLAYSLFSARIQLDRVELDRFKEFDEGAEALP